MTITVNDLALHYSQDTTETDTGGGAMSSAAIPDNTVENVFRNISRADRVRGDIQLQRVWFRLKSANMNSLKDAIAYLDNQPQDPKTYVSLIRTDLERRNEVLEKIIPSDLAADADCPIITVSLNENFAADAVKLTVYAAKNSGITGGTESSLKRAFLWIRGHEPYEIAY
ncbi:MAG: hypothetical protein GY862_07690, partial [Gammaproteobacteria bacterium]|nr:hypothetical protein [Gammaproteobacteria bacterium]